MCLSAEDGAIIIAAGRSRDVSMEGPHSERVKQAVTDILSKCCERRSILKGDGGLQGTIDDLYMMNHFLKSRDVSIDQMHTLTQGERPGIREIILSQLKNLFDSKRLGFVLYFTGHGSEHGDWVLGQQSILTFSDVYDAFVSRCCPPEAGLRAMQKLLIIADSCCSGRWVQQLEAKRRQQGSSPDADRVFVQAACCADQATRDQETGGLFTKLYTEPKLVKLHDGGTMDCLSAQEKSDEVGWISRLSGQVPDASIAGLTFVVNIGKGLGLTKCWAALCQETPDPGTSSPPEESQPSPEPG